MFFGDRRLGIDTGRLCIEYYKVAYLCGMMLVQIVYYYKYSVVSDMALSYRRQWLLYRLKCVTGNLVIVYTSSPVINKS